MIKITVLHRQDVIDGYVSLDFARSAYGVVLTDDLELLPQS
ncbi:MAG: hypothetical protein V3S21_08415 [Xanthomonadales bacterium]